MTVLSIEYGDYRMRSEFVAVLNQILLGSASLDDFQTWLLSNLQSILDSGDSGAIDAANELDADLMQLAQGEITDNQLIEDVGLWAERLQTIVMSLASENVRPNEEPVAVGSNSSTVTTTIKYPRADLAFV